MAYIIAVNASIVADSGGTCVCPGTEADPICNKDEAYLLCLQGIKRDAVTATASISALASFCMGLFANLWVPETRRPSLCVALTWCATVPLASRPAWVCRIIARSRSRFVLTVLL